MSLIYGVNPVTEAVASGKTINKFDILIFIINNFSNKAVPQKISTKFKKISNIIIRR